MNPSGRMGMARWWRIAALGGLALAAMAALILLYLAHLEKKAWEEAISRSTPVAFERFLHHYPDSEFAPQARAQVRRLIAEGLPPAVREIKRARIMVDEEYREGELISGYREILGPLIRYTAEDFLKYVGVDIGDSAGQGSEAVLEIRIRGQFNGTQYGKTAAEFYWTGAVVEGRVRFKASDLEVREEFAGKSGSLEPPKNITPHRYSTTPHLIVKQAGLPLIEAKIAKVVARVFGTQALVAYLYPQRAAKYEGAVAALQELKDPATVEPLIEMLADGDEGIRGDARNILKAITGQDFKDDQEKWQEWWAQNRADTDH